MKKIHKLREWLTVDEATEHLSLVLDEDVSRAELLRLALDGHLTLSVNLVNKARARLGRIAPFKDVPMREFSFPPMEGQPEIGPVPAGLLLDRVSKITEETPFLCLDDEVVTIDGVWDLTMKGAEVLDVEHEFQQLTDGPEITLVYLEGVFLSRADGRWAQLQDRFDDREIKMPDGKKKQGRGNYFPTGGLPHDAHLVMKVVALTDFLSRMSSQETPGGADVGSVGTRERDTLLKLVIGMAIGGYGHDPNASRTPTSSNIVADLTRQGLQITDDTVRKYLKEATAVVLNKHPKV